MITKQIPNIIYNNQYHIKMKKHTITFLAGTMLAISSCSPGSSSTGSTTVAPIAPVDSSTFNVTISGHNYHIAAPRGVSGSAGNNLISAVTATGYGSGKYSGRQILNSLIEIEDGGKSLHFVVSGQRLDLSSALGTYLIGIDTANSTATNYGGFQVLDIGDGGKLYQAAFDTTSTITVSLSNSTEVKGTFNLKGRYNGTLYPITGDFDYKK
jgi:hypothetical protein